MGAATPRSDSNGVRLARSDAERIRRATAAFVALLLVLGIAVVETFVPVASAEDNGNGNANLSFSKSADDDVLAGSGISYHLTASNPTDGTPLFNVSFRDVLPPGVEYDPGSTSPPSAGEPRIITADVEVEGVSWTQQTLIWDNVSDLPSGGTATVSFRATPAYEGFGDPPAEQGYLVGSTLGNTGQAAASTEPRFIARTDEQGGFTDDRDGVVSSTADTASTRVSALEIDKAEPSPSGRLLRGLADQVTVYTLTVTNNDVSATEDVVVVDRLPAQLEFLGCDDITMPEEYPEAGPTSLTALTDCHTPVSVDTVEVADEVFTEVTWELGTLAASETRVIEYRAAIPLLANTLDWGNGPPASATIEEPLGHGASLTNNTGESTREETDNSQSVTNEAVATGTYTGPVFEDGDPSVQTQAELTRVVADVRLQKSASPTTTVRWRSRPSSPGSSPTCGCRSARLRRRSPRASSSTTR